MKVIENAAGGRLSVGEASRLLQLSERQVERLKRRYRPDSIGWVQHGDRGHPMPSALLLPQKQLILTLARGKYQGFDSSHTQGKTFAAKKTLRSAARPCAASCAPPTSASPEKRRPRESTTTRRPPRPRFGMMALTDASRHVATTAVVPTHPDRFWGRRRRPDSGCAFPTRSRNCSRLSPPADRQ